MTLEASPRAPGAAKASFMQAVENALKRRVIKFEIDIAHDLSALEEIFLQLVALQKVLAKRGERIVLVSRVQLPPDLEEKLHSAGVEMKVEQEIKSIGGHLDFVEFYKQAKLKNWPALEDRFKQVYEELKNLIQTERALQKEIEFYKKRIVNLRPLIPDNVKLDQLSKKNTDHEKALNDLMVQNENMRAEIAKLSQDLQTKQALYKNKLEASQ